MPLRTLINTYPAFKPIIVKELAELTNEEFENMLAMPDEQFRDEIPGCFTMR